MDAQKIIKIKRFDKSKDCTIGAMYDESELFALTLELPWLLNASFTSCIPKGEYLCKMKLSKHFQMPLWEVQDVPNRTNIEIHPANKTSELLGCVAVGHNLSILKGPDQIYESRDAFNDLMNRTQDCQNIKLVIEEV